MICKSDVSEKTSDTFSDVGAPESVSGDDVEGVFSNFLRLFNDTGLRNFEHYARFVDRIRKCGVNEWFGFNILDACGISHRELSVCRLLGTLLDPKGDHGMGSLFLKRFLQILYSDDSDAHSGKNFFSTLCERADEAYVELEFPCRGRRIDILINIDGFHIPVEVKIYARDLSNQCSDYLSYCLEKNRKSEREKSGDNFSDHTRIVYLTLNGRNPDDCCMPPEEENRNRVKCLSFRNEIYEWLKGSADDLRTDLNSEKEDSDPDSSSRGRKYRLGRVLDVVEQFMDAVKRITGRLDMDEIEYFAKVNSEKNSKIISCCEDFMAAQKFCNEFFPSVKISMFLKFFEALYEHLKKKLKEFNLSEENFIYESDLIFERARKIIIENRCIYNPSVAILLPKHRDYEDYNFVTDYKIILSIDIEGGQCVYGYSVEDIDCDNGIDGLKKRRALREYVCRHTDNASVPGVESDNFAWWFAVKKFRFDHEPIDFVNCNVNYCKLYDHEHFNSVVGLLTDEVAKLYRHWAEQDSCIR